MLELVWALSFIPSWVLHFQSIKFSTRNIFYEKRAINRSNDNKKFEVEEISQTDAQFRTKANTANSFYLIAELGNNWPERKWYSFFDVLNVFWWFR